MSNLTPFGNNPNSLSSHTFFDMLNQVENMMFNSFQSVFTPLNNTSYTDQGQQYVFTLTFPNLKRENIQLIVEDQTLILTIKQVIQTNEEMGQMYQSSSFSQSFSLHDIDADKITAQLKQETLTIILPKKETVIVNRRLINIL
ncbi:MAG: Hsp20 family protein [Turicibacter sp.]|nr:Hsp20 family protein [Turicibacter sp.]